MSLNSTIPVIFRPDVLHERDDRDAGPMHALVLPALIELLIEMPSAGRLLDVGCGDGFLAGQIQDLLGYEVTGIDLSQQEVARARATYPKVRFEALEPDQHLFERLEEQPFDVVMSIELIEHLHDPRSFIRGCMNALRPGGKLILSTPYYGYLKNLAVALSNRWDDHTNPLCDGGHIKLWSRRTLAQLLQEVGFTEISFRGVGRCRYLWIKTIATAIKPR